MFVIRDSIGKDFVPISLIPNSGKSLRNQTDSL